MSRTIGKKENLSYQGWNSYPLHYTVDPIVIIISNIKKLLYLLAKRFKKMPTWLAIRLHFQRQLNASMSPEGGLIHGLKCH